MQAVSLRRGDLFVYVSPKEWDDMSAGDRKREKRVKVERWLGACVAVDRFHLATSSGDWCIPREAEVVLLEHPAAKGAAA